MFTKIRLVAFVAVFGLSIAMATAGASARIISLSRGTIFMKSGNQGGLQYAFAWGASCQTVNVDFRGRASAGRLYQVSRNFTIRGGRCSGHTVSGYTVVYQAPSNFKGRVKIIYALKPANVRNVYRVSRTIIVR